MEGNSEACGYLFLEECTAYHLMAYGMSTVPRMTPTPPTWLPLGLLQINAGSTSRAGQWAVHSAGSWPSQQYQRQGSLSLIPEQNQDQAIPREGPVLHLLCAWKAYYILWKGILKPRTVLLSPALLGSPVSLPV